MAMHIKTSFSKDVWWTPVALWIRELTLNPRSGHMWESQVLLTDGQVVFPQVLRFSSTFDERSSRYK